MARFHVRSWLGLLAAALPAQQPVSWRTLPQAGPPLAAAWDATRQSTVLITYDDVYRQWQWDGTAAVERIAALPGTSNLVWLGDDPLRRELVALTLQPVRIGTWNGARWSWQTPPSAPSFGAATRFAFDARRSRLVACQPSTAATDVFEWDGAMWWSFAGLPGPGPRPDAAFSFDPVGVRCVLYGGTTGSIARADCWSWDGSAWTQIAAVAPPGPRANAALAFAASPGGMLLYGGNSTTSTWRLAGNVWTQVPTAHDPGRRDRAHLVPDPFGMLLVGGTTDPFGTAWRYTGTDWVAVGEFVNPPAIEYAAAAWDDVRGQVVRFFGADTHLFDTRWHGTSPSSSPPPRDQAMMCWSSVEQLVLLFGGVGSFTPLADTWSWTGSAWIARVSPVSPSPRLGAWIAEDPNGGVMLFGGTNGMTYLGDHWHWDGVQWLQRTPALLPAPRAYGHAALVRARNRVVALDRAPFGPTETWEWDGAAWTGPLSIGLGGPTVAFDPRRGRVVAMASAPVEWTGAAWVAIPTGNGPLPPSIGTTPKVSDLLRQRLLSFGTTVVQLTPTAAAAVAFGSGCALGPSPALHAIGDPTPGNARFALEIGSLLPSAGTFLVLGLGSQNQPLGSGCTLLVAQQLATLFVMAPPSGQVLHPIPIPNDPGLRGVQFVAQGAVFDPPRSLLGSVTVTAGLRVTIGD